MARTLAACAGDRRASRERHRAGDPLGYRRYFFAFGADYTPNFNFAFTNGTSVTFQVICPTTAGGNVQHQLFLTATNRSSLGGEAYVAYDGATNLFEFDI